MRATAACRHSEPIAALIWSPPRQMDTRGSTATRAGTDTRGSTATRAGTDTWRGTANSPDGSGVARHGGWCRPGRGEIAGHGWIVNSTAGCRCGSATVRDSSPSPAPAPAHASRGVVRQARRAAAPSPAPVVPRTLTRRSSTRRSSTQRFSTQRSSTRRSSTRRSSTQRSGTQRSGTQRSGTRRSGTQRSGKPRSSRRLEQVGTQPNRSRTACTTASGASRDRKCPAIGTTRRS